jgi:hypothetical protein
MYRITICIDPAGVGIQISIAFTTMFVLDAYHFLVETAINKTPYLTGLNK